MSNPNEPTVVVTLTTIYEKLLDIDKKVDPLPRQIEDHEFRLRTLERKVWAAAGAAAALASGVTAALSRLGGGG